MFIFIYYGIKHQKYSKNWNNWFTKVSDKRSIHLKTNNSIKHKEKAKKKKKKKKKKQDMTVGFFIPVSSLKVFGHSIHSERRRIYLGKSIQALQNDTIIISWVFSFRVIQPTVRWHTFKTFMFVFINSCSS